MRLRDVRSAAVSGKRVLIRVDYDVDITSGGTIRDATRLTASLPTLRWVIRHGGQPTLIAHRGRPTSRPAALSLAPVVPWIKRRLGRPVRFIRQPLFSTAARQTADRADAKAIILLENIRFESGEEKNSRRLAIRLASFGEVYVNDAFATAHRAHASVVGLARLRPAYAGLALQREVKELTAVVQRPRRPYVAILGGAKISTKIGLIRSLLKQADYVLLGGALANTILRAQGLAIGASRSEPAMFAAARTLAVTNPRLKIPVDVVVAKNASSTRPIIRAVGNVRPRESIFDIGPDTIGLYSTIIRQARTVVWNGPMGVYERRPFASGTRRLARAIARHHCQSIAGGGETIDAINDAGLAGRFHFLSTGGGAMMEFIEGRRLPGLAAVAVDR